MKRLLLIFLLTCQASFAQEANRYMVFFTDKEGSSYTTAAPHAFLTERALARRQAQQLPVTLQDLPVSEQYVHELQQSGAAVFFRSRWLNAVLIEAPADQITALAALPFVDKIDYAAPGTRLTARSTSGGASTTTTTTTTTTSQVPQDQLELLQIPLLHQQGITGKGKLIAVLDDGFAGVATGTKFDHLYRNNQLQHTRDFVGNSSDVYRYDDHGTKSLSTIAVVDSGTFIGVAPNAQFLLAVTEDVTTEYIIEEYNWLLAAEWADSLGADIITSSLGYTTFDDPAMDHTYADFDGATTIAARAANWATERGILVVSSAGNNRSAPWYYISTPADAQQIIAVGAVDAGGALAGFSSGGPTADGRIKPEVVAQGKSTVVVTAAGEYRLNNGTSFSAPQIAGLAALLWEAYPALTNLELRDMMLQAGDRSSSPDNMYGYGIPQFHTLTSVEEVAEVQNIRLFPNPFTSSSGFQKLQLRGVATPLQQLQVLDASGRQVAVPAFQQQLSGEYEVDVAGLAPGLYFLHIISDTGNSMHKFLRL